MFSQYWMKVLDYPAVGLSYGWTNDTHLILQVHLHVYIGSDDRMPPINKYLVYENERGKKFCSD